jgi:phosphomannomutase
MRGVMGGQQSNKYTLGKVHKAYQIILKPSFPNQPLKAVIAYDCRQNSDTLAKLLLMFFRQTELKCICFQLRPTPSCLCSKTFG